MKNIFIFLLVMTIFLGIAGSALAACTSDADCNAGSRCAVGTAYGDGIRYCTSLSNCENNDECTRYFGSDYTCVNRACVGPTVYPCGSNADCTGYTNPTLCAVSGAPNRTLSNGTVMVRAGTCVSASCTDTPDCVRYFGPNYTCASGSNGSYCINSPSTFNVKLDNPLCFGGSCINDFQGLLTAIMTYIIGLVTSIAVILFFYAGFLYITSAGNEGRLSTAKKVLIYAIIGVAIASAATGLIEVIKYVITGSP